MTKQRRITTVDSHTGGEPTRVIVDGLPPIPGETMTEKMSYFREHLDPFRTALLHEPRGHGDMVGAVLVEPCSEGADFGVFYLDRDRCFAMCGHGTIGVGVTLIRTGRVPFPDPETAIVLDTPAGPVNLRARAEGDVLEVSVVNVPSFVAAEKITLDLPNRSVVVDVAFGGGFFSLVDAGELGLDIVPENVTALTREAVSIAAAAERTITVAHPEYPDMKQAGLVYLYGPAPAESEAHARSLAVGPRGNFDRSPCGTGTSSRLAALYARGQLGIDEPFRVESVNGTQFVARIVEETRVGDHVAIVPEIISSAFVTGNHEFLIDPADPLKNGFLI